MNQFSSLQWFFFTSGWWLSSTSVKSANPYKKYIANEPYAFERNNDWEKMQRLIKFAYCRNLTNTYWNVYLLKSNRSYFNRKTGKWRQFKSLSFSQAVVNWESCHGALSSWRINGNFQNVLQWIAIIFIKSFNILLRVHIFNFYWY